MLYDPITGIKVLGLEKVQTTVNALKAGAWYPIEWIHEIVEFPEGKLVVTTNTLKRFKINRNHVPSVMISNAVRQCKNQEDVNIVNKAIAMLSPSQKASVPNNIWEMLKQKQEALTKGEEIHLVEKKPVAREKDAKYPFLTLCKNHNVLLDCHKANVKDVHTGEYRKSTFKYYWVTDGTVRELASDAAIISNPKTVVAMASHKYSGGTDLVTPSVNKIVRIHKTYAD